MSAVDKFRDKWETITPRERRMVVVLGVSIVVIVILYVSLAIRDGLDALEERNAKARRALVTLTAMRAQAKHDNPDDPAKLIGAEPIGLETYVFEAGKKAGVTVPEVNKRTPVPRGKYTAHSVSVQLRSLTLSQAKDFLEAVENTSRIVIVSSLDLRRNFQDKEKLDLNCEIVTWAKVGEAPDDGAAAKKGS